MPKLLPADQRLAIQSHWPGSVVVHYTVDDMSPVAAEARKAMAESQFAVPAREATKQEAEKTRQAEEETKRHRIDSRIVGGIAVGVMVLLGVGVWHGNKLEPGPLLILLALAILAVARHDLSKLLNAVIERISPARE